MSILTAVDAVALLLPYLHNTSHTQVPGVYFVLHKSSQGLLEAIYYII